MPLFTTGISQFRYGSVYNNFNSLANTNSSFYNANHAGSYTIVFPKFIGSFWQKLNFIHNNNKLGIM